MKISGEEKVQRGSTYEISHFLNWKKVETDFENIGEKKSDHSVDMNF